MRELGTRRLICVAGLFAASEHMKTTRPCVDVHRALGVAPRVQAGPQQPATAGAVAGLGRGSVRGNRQPVGGAQVSRRS